MMLLLLKNYLMYLQEEIKVDHFLQLMNNTFLILKEKNLLLIDEGKQEKLNLSE